MTTAEFFSKLKSKYLWSNLVAMAAVVVLLCVGTSFGLDLYTHHGEAITIPNLKHKSYDDAEQILKSAGLRIEVSDTGYIKSLPPDCILGQTPDPGTTVKGGHVIYVTINATRSPTITLPDIIDNSSLREAMAKLTAMGFKVGTPQFIPGEKDWVYGILVNGRHVSTGDRVSVDATLIIQVGNGQQSADADVEYVDPDVTFDEEPEDMGSEDPFTEVDAPPVEEKSESPESEKIASGE